MRVCAICDQPIKLVPSAVERAKRDKSGNPPSYYTNLFTQHASCTIAKRSEQARELMRKLRQ